MQSEEIIKTISEKKTEEYMKNASPEDLKNIESLYQKIHEEVLEIIQNQNTNIKDISSNNLSYTMIEFYTLIAMACLYGGILGMVSINQNLANMSSKGKRVSVAPISKGKVILSTVLASYMTQLIGLAILFLYTVFVLKVDYGSNLPLIILLGVVGSLAGLSFGIAIRNCF
ncbi:MAG: ABC transporter permease [Clostridia bacterium]|nr:ABC transporter permease [Clostridia bacterium]